jgi:hypothetical protein
MKLRIRHRPTSWMESPPCGSTIYTARGKKWPMFVVPALAGIQANNRLKAGLQTAHLQPRAVYISDNFPVDQDF